MNCGTSLTGAGSGAASTHRARLRALAFPALLLLGALLGLMARPAHAQNTGSIFGTVEDSTGALIPHANVTAFDKTHNLTRTVTSNASGEFSLQSLPIGTYQLSVSYTGFEKYVIDNIKLDAEQSVKEVVKMHAGAADVSITVTDTSSVGLDAKSGELGMVIDNDLVENLPIDGENIVALAALLPGVVDVNAPVTFTSDTGGPTYSANGGRNNMNLMLFDGLMFNNLFYNTGVNFPPHPALQEISVILNNYKAEYGRSAGSIFNVLTRSGTDQVHGEIWEFLQNQMFNATDYISRINPEDNYNQFGGTVGGPIFRDKAFYFVSFQQLIGRRTQVGSDSTGTLADRGLEADGVTALPCINDGEFPAGTSCANFTDQLIGVQNNQLTFNKFVNPLDVPTSGGGAVATPEDAIAMITSAWQQAGGNPNGDIPCLDLLTDAESYAATVPYYNSYNGTQSYKASVQATYLPDGQVPTACLNPVMMGIIKKYVPLPNTPTVSGVVQTDTVAPLPEFDTNILGRLDYHTSRHTIDARYNLDRATATDSVGGDIPTYNPDVQFADMNFGDIGDTWVLTPNLLNIFRAGYKRYENGHTPTDPTTMEDFGGVFPEPGLPTLPQINGGYHLGTSSQGYLDTINEDFELNDKLSWTHGNHNFAGGFNFLRLQYLNRSDYAGELSFSSTFTRLSLADNEMGLPTSVQAQSRLNQGGIQHDVYMYFQDDWRATSNLTLNLGVRYELPFQWFQPQGEAATFIPGIQSTRFPNAPAGLGFPGDKTVLPSLVPTDFSGIAPRFGFADDVGGNGRLVLRGGFGMFFDAVNANVVGVGEPFHYLFFANLPDGGASNALSGFPAIPEFYNPKNPQFLPPYSIFFPDRNFRTPYVEAGNLGFSYRVPHGGTLNTNYILRLARKLTIPLDLNPAIYDCSGGYFQANPAVYCTNAAAQDQSYAARVRYTNFNYGGQGIVDILSVGTSNYNALQMLYQQRGGKMLNLTTSFTYSKSIDLQTNGQTTENTAPDVFDIESERGRSDSNAKFIYNMGWVLKFPPLTSGSAFTRAVLNNWLYSGETQMRTGHPFSVTINDDQALNGEPNQRAALVPGINPLLPSNRHRAQKIAEWFNVDAFSYPYPQGTFSSQQRNSFTGPAYMLTAMNIGRQFSLASIREGMRMEIRAEAFNVFNTPNLANPKSTFSCNSTNLYGGPCSTVLNPNDVSSQANFSATSTFGTITQTQGNADSTQTTGRRMQFALTIYY